ncbi:MAG: GyrI-like domain-containing protein [Saprospiraceae bacterium]|nr:GyrI-like domain-containing protein [Saprospiraceae bacterium]
MGRESPALKKLHAFAKENGLTVRGKHHEIYLSDPNRTASEQMKIMLRHAVN